MSKDIWEHQLIIIMRFWFLIVMNAIIHMPIHMFFFSAHILVGNQFAVVFPILKLLIVFNVSGGRIVFELELYKNTRIWDCAWCGRNEGNNDRDVAKKRKSDCFVFMCVCACARTHVCGRSLYLDISHHLSRKHGGQVFFWYSSANVSPDGDSGLVLKTQRADLTCHGA